MREFLSLSNQFIRQSFLTVSGVMAGRSTVRSRSNGWSLVEVLVGVAVFLVVFTALLTTLMFYLQSSLAGPDHIKSTYLMHEGAELVRIIRDDHGWEEKLAGLAPDTDYRLVQNNEGWELEAGEEVLADGFGRRIRVEPVYRDQFSDDIVPAGSPNGSLDPNTALFVVEVSGPGFSGLSDRQMKFYLTNLFE